jgi:hypothetical protein
MNEKKLGFRTATLAAIFTSFRRRENGTVLAVN